MKYLEYLILVGLFAVSGQCNISEKIEVDQKLNSTLIVSDLQSKGYDVEINSYKGTHSYVTAYPNTKMIDGDLQKICSLPNLRNLIIDNNKIAESFFNQLDECNLGEMKLLSLKDVAIKNGLFCQLSEKNQFHNNLGFVNTNINDEDLNCLKRFEFIEELSFQGPLKKFSNEAFCNLCKSDMKIKSFHLTNIELSPKEFNCLLDLKGVEFFGFKKSKAAPLVI